MKGHIHPSFHPPKLATFLALVKLGFMTRIFKLSNRGASSLSLSMTAIKPCSIILKRLENPTTNMPSSRASSKSKKNIQKVKAVLAAKKKAKHVKFDEVSEEVSFDDYILKVQ